MNNPVRLITSERESKMTREYAKQIAKAAFEAMNAGHMQYWLGKTGQDIVEADFNYKHGWIHLFGYGFRGDELSNGAEQPYMD